QVRTGEAGRLARDLFERHGIVNRLSARVHFKYRLPPANVRIIKDYLPVESPRPQERGIEDVGPVRRRDDDDIRAAVESVHLDENLIECLLALVVAPAESRTALTPNRIDLIDEDDAGCVALGLIEEITHAGRANAD